MDELLRSRGYGTAGESSWDPAELYLVVTEMPKDTVGFWALDLLPLGVGRRARTARGWPRPRWLIAIVFAATPPVDLSNRRRSWSMKDLGVRVDPGCGLAVAAIAPDQIPQGLYTVGMYTKPSREDVRRIAQRFVDLTATHRTGEPIDTSRGTTCTAMAAHLRRGDLESSVWNQAVIPISRAVGLTWGGAVSTTAGDVAQAFLDVWATHRSAEMSPSDADEDDDGFIEVIRWRDPGISGRSILGQTLILPSAALQDIALGSAWSAYVRRGAEMWYRPQYCHARFAVDPEEESSASERGDSGSTASVGPKRFRRDYTRFTDPLCAQYIRAHAGVGCHPSTAAAAIGVLGWELTTWACIDFDNHTDPGIKPTRTAWRHARDELRRRIAVVRWLYPDAIVEARYELIGFNPALGGAVLGLWRRGGRVVHRNPADPRQVVAGVHCWINLGGWRRRDGVIAEITTALLHAGLAAGTFEVYPREGHGISLPLRRDPRADITPARRHRVDQTVAAYELVDDNLIPVVGIVSASTAERLQHRHWSGINLIASPGYRRRMWERFDRLWAASRPDPRAHRVLPVEVTIRFSLLKSVPALGACWELPAWAVPQRPGVPFVPAWSIDTIGGDAVEMPISPASPRPSNGDPGGDRIGGLPRMTLLTESEEAQFGEAGVVAAQVSPRRPPQEPPPDVEAMFAATQRLDTGFETTPPDVVPFSAGRRNAEILAMVRDAHSKGISEQRFVALHDARFAAGPTRTGLEQSREQAVAAFRYWVRRCGPPRCRTPGGSSDSKESLRTAVRAGVVTTGILQRSAVIDACVEAIVGLLGDARGDPRTIGVRLLTDAYLGDLLGVPAEQTNRRPQHRLKRVLIALGAVPLRAKEAARRIRAARLDAYVGRARFFDLRGVLSAVLPESGT